MLVICSILAGCAVGVPEIKEVWDADYPGNENSNPPTPSISGSAQIEFEIKKRVFCQLRDAVREALRFKNQLIVDGRVVKSPPSIPLDWGAQMSLSLEVEEQSTISPGISFIEPFSNAITNRVGSTFVSTPQARSLGIGGQLSSTATRTDKINAFYSVKYLASKEADKYVCISDDYDPFRSPKVNFDYAKSSPFILTGDLGLSKWLVGSIWASNQLPSVGVPTSARKGDTQDGPAKKPDTLSVDIKFVIVSSANITPSWKLVRVSANTGGALLDVGRKRTHELIITLGPDDKPTNDSFLALQIGQAINNRTVNISQP